MGLHGLAMPDPYGLAQFTDPLLPHNPTAEQLLEALQLWGVPEDAYPPPGSCEVNYKLELWEGKSMQVFLRRQCFVIKLWTTKTSYFSFFASLEFAIGRMENPIPPGQNVPNRGYNHCNAVLSFGEAQMLAGWTTQGVAMHSANHFKLHKQPDQRYPPVL